MVEGGGNIRFSNQKWSSSSAPIEVFDATFIADNIYAGELTDLAHDRGLFSIIIGPDGVKLAKKLEFFNAAAKSTAGNLKDAEAALRDDVPTDMTMDEFFALAPDPRLDRRIDEAEKALKSVQQAERVEALKPLEELAAPTVPAEAGAILASTIPEIDKSARQRLVEHFMAFQLGRKGEEWVTYGLEHIHNDACAFCGREGVDELGLVTLYNQIFGDTYKTHLKKIVETSALVEAALGEELRGALARTIAANAEAARSWAEFVKIDAIQLPDMAACADNIAAIHGALKGLFDRKRLSPLERADADEELQNVANDLNDVHLAVWKYNDAVRQINAITAKQVAAPRRTEAEAKQTWDNLIKRKRRTDDPGVQKRIEGYLATKRQDKRAREMRTLVQTRLKKANETAAEHYHERVNFHLGRFGTSFTISKITNSMVGNAGSADYGLLIRGVTISRGRGRQADAKPTFRNTLSTGDKTTLAFAFFLAGLERDAQLSSKVLVFDDPLSSHDSHRKHKTIEALRDLCGTCDQVLVLSHDQYFLRDVSARCVGVEKASYHIEFDGGDNWSSAKAVDLDELCRGAHARAIEKLQRFYSERHGQPDDVVLNVRQVLETHFRRSYTAYFNRDENLGGIIKAIRDGGPQHPCHRDLHKLDSCNDATCEEHHGEDALLMPKTGLDPDELRIIVGDCLELVGATRPS